MNSPSKKPNLARRWQTEEPSLTGDEHWGVLVQACRVNDEEILGWCWALMHDNDGPIVTGCFHREPATALLRTLYSAFAALDDPNDYLIQVGLGWTLDAKPPTVGIVGSAEDYGAVQVFVDWSTPRRYSTFMVYPPDGARMHVLLGIESVAHLVQLVTEAFHALEWAVPE